jgi:amino acid transporter
MSMSRDGLLPKKFSKLSKRYKTPGFATIMTGFLVGIPVLFVDDKLMTDLTSIGTLFAFVLVCGGVLVLPRLAKEQGKFQLPYINGQFIIPAIVVLFAILFRERILSDFSNITSEAYQEILFLIFVIASVVLALLSFIRKYSVIPVSGVLCCLYLMIEIPGKSWMVFFGWMALGLSIYLVYGRSRSKLANS